MKFAFFVALAALPLVLSDSAWAAPQKMTSILDKNAQLSSWKWRDNLDDDWFKTRIPFWQSPDEEIDKTYYYRWELVTKHMVYGSPQTGYNFTEFIDRPGWSGAYGSISCPLGLQISELRWLKDRRITDDFVRYWHSAPGAQPRSYSNWYGDAIWGNYLVNGDAKFMVSLLPSMEAQYQGWLKEHWDENHGMFHWSSMHDGMEFTIGSRQTQDEFAGGDSYRPTLNSYVYGDLMALSKVAKLAGETQKSADYLQKAGVLKKRVQDELWDKKRGFFSSQFVNDEERDGFKIKAKTLIYEDGKYKGNSHGRELSGFVPWQFNLPDQNQGYENAWKAITDSEMFFGEHGLRFTEKNDPLFLIAQHGCVWSGNEWPYADSLVLGAMANVINNYPQKAITKADYWKVFQLYSNTQRKDGAPYIAEMSDPNNGRWVQDVYNSSEHYFHSSFNDLLITGIAGLRPREDETIEINPLAPENWDYFALDEVAYRGHSVSIVWDKTGQKYGRGQGLMIFADGQKLAQTPKLGRLTAKLPTVKPVAAPVARLVNFAVNNDGAYFPRLRASFVAPKTSTGHLNDGNFFYHAVRPRFVWTNETSTNATETLELDFGIARPIDSVKFYVLDDGEGQVRAPAKIELQFWDGNAWKNIPGATQNPTIPQGHKPNIFSFPTLQTTKLRALLTPQNGLAVGLSEWEAWGEAPLPLAEPQVADNLARGAKISASFTSKFDRVEEANDGQIVMNGGRNRWTAFESPNDEDWLQLDFGKTVTVSRVEVCLWADTDGIRLPKALKLQSFDGQKWVDLPEIKREPAQFAEQTPVEIEVAPTKTEKLRLILTHAAPKRSGVTEWLVF